MGPSSDGPRRALVCGAKGCRARLWMCLRVHLRRGRWWWVGALVVGWGGAWGVMGTGIRGMGNGDYDDTFRESGRLPAGQLRFAGTPHRPVGQAAQG
jgi:hypothetical protein